MRRKLIAGNWKMYKTMAETREFCRQIVKMELDKDVDSAIIVPFTDISVAKGELDDAHIGVGAQNVHFAPEGAYTGEVSLAMLKELDVDYIVVGHSERRAYFGETDRTCNSKLKAILGESDITPIYCLGESIEEREANIQEEIVLGQLKNGLDGISENLANRVVIAYEPIWAIGTGKTATSQEAEDMCKFIRKSIGEIYSKDLADRVIIQYGGSVKPENVKELMSMENIDGALVGGASLSADSFAKLVNFAKAFAK